MKRTIWSAVVATFLLLFGLPATSQVEFSDCLTVFDPTGAIFRQVCATEANEELTPFFSIPDVAGDESQFGIPTALVEPDGTVSDTFGVAFELQPLCLGNGFCLFFTSTSDLLPGPPPARGLPTFPDGGPFDATLYLAPALRVEGFTAQFFSDAEPAPEPATAVLLALGLLVMGATLSSGRRSPSLRGRLAHSTQS